MVEVQECVVFGESIESVGVESFAFAVSFETSEGCCVGVKR